MNVFEEVKDLKKLIIGVNHVLVKINQTKDKTDLVLPDSITREKPVTGTIVSVGSEVKDLEEGQIVLDMQKEGIVGFTCREEFYLLPPRHLVRIVTTPENYGTNFK